MRVRGRVIAGFSVMLLVGAAASAQPPARLDGAIDLTGPGGVIRHRRAVDAIRQLGGTVTVLNKRVLEVTLSGPRVTDDDLRHLKDLDNLGVLVLIDTGATDDGLARLAELPSLRIIEIKGGAVTDTGISRLRLANPRLHATRSLTRRIAIPADFMPRSR